MSLSHAFRRSLATRAAAPLSPFQRVTVAIASAFGAIINPERGDLIAALGETTGEGAGEVGRVTGGEPASPDLW